MEINGCGKRNVELTFYLLPNQPMSKHRVSPPACGQRAESLVGRGVLLCADCAGLHGLNGVTGKVGCRTNLPRHLPRSKG